MITHFITASDFDEDRPNASKAKPDKWVIEYREGRCFHLCGFLVNTNYAGIAFAQFAILCSRRSVTPIAVQLDGKIQLAPDYTIEAGDVVFALVRKTEDIAEFQDKRSNWRSTFKERQEFAQRDAKETLMKKAAPAHEPRSLMAPGQRGSICGSENIITKHVDGTPINLPVDSHVHTSLSLSAAAKLIARTSRLADMITAQKDPEHVKEGMKILETKAARIAKEGGHYILVLLQGAPWQQVNVFLSTLRAKHLPFHIPILVLIPPPLPHPSEIIQIFNRYPRTGFVKTSGTATIADLQEANLTEAHCIALLAGNAGQASQADRRMVDGTGVTLLVCIEAELMQSNAASVPVFLELHQQESIRFLSRFFERDNQHCTSDAAFDPTEGFTSHPRFANGNIFTASCFGATVARSFNSPGIVELMEAITLGGTNNQSAFPWQVSIPEGFETKMYGDLVGAFLESHGAVCLGMFRLCFPDDSLPDGARFVVTNPEQSTMLRASDFIFVLGSADFGQYCFDKGIVVSTAGAPRSTDPEEVLVEVETSQEAPPQQDSDDEMVWMGHNITYDENDNLNGHDFVSSSLPRMHSARRGHFDRSADREGGLSARITAGLSMIPVFARSSRGGDGSGDDGSGDDFCSLQQ